MSDESNIEGALRAYLSSRSKDKAGTSPADYRSSKKRRSAEELAAVLKVRLNLLLEKNVFSVGDIVEWKDGLRNKVYPDYGVPAIVVDVLDEPVIADSGDSGDSGSQYFREPLDMVIAIISEDDDDLMFMHCDSRRFRIKREVN